MTAHGIPADAVEFYVQLEADNSRSFWQANKDRYRTSVRDPLEALTAELADYGPFHIFRPYQDARFAKGRPPYKTHVGAYGESEAGAGYYLQLGSEGLLLAAGYYTMASDQLTRFREAVADEGRGEELVRLTAALEASGCTIGAMSTLVTAPRGYPRDHPRIGLLRRKGLIAARTVGIPGWLATPDAPAHIRTVWEGMGPLCHWLDTHVGPSTLPPDERGRPF